MTRVYFSKAYRICYLLVILMSLLSVLAVIYTWEMATAWWLVALISLLISLMLGDVTWRAGTQGPSVYFKEWKSLLDLIVTLATLSLLAVGAFTDGAVRNLCLISGFVIATCKSVALFCRLQNILRSINRTDMSVIDLNDMSEVDRVADANKSGIVLFRNDEFKEPADEENASSKFINEEDS